MHHRRVEPAQAVEWIRRAVQLIFANPAAFLLMGLAMTLVALVPVLGGLVLLVVGPALYAGIALAARSQDQGESADFNQLFEGFTQPGKTGPLIALCLPNVGFIVVAVVVLLAVVVVSGAAALIAAGGQDIDPSTFNPLALIGTGGVLTLLLVLAPLAVMTASLLFFAVPRVMFDGLDPFPAMRESAQAAFANFGAFLLTVLILFFARAALLLALSWVPLYLGAIAVGSLFTPLIACVLYVAWKDVFAASQRQEDDAAAPPSPPPSIEV